MMKTGTDNAGFGVTKMDTNGGQNGVFLSQEVSIYKSGLSCNNVEKTKTASPDFSKTCGHLNTWYPHGDSNPSLQTENLSS